MATLQQIRDKIDPILADLATKIDARQAVYFANNGEYFQGKWTHQAEPVDGVDTTPDNLADTPTNIQTRWNQLLAGVDLPAQLPMRIKCDVYQNAAGWGYWLTVQVKLLNGDVWQRSRNMQGNETQNTEAWHKVNVVGV